MRALFELHQQFHYSKDFGFKQPGRRTKAAITYFRCAWLHVVVYYSYTIYLTVKKFMAARAIDSNLLGSLVSILWIWYDVLDVSTCTISASYTHDDDDACTQDKLGQFNEVMKKMFPCAAVTGTLKNSCAISFFPHFFVCPKASFKHHHANKKPVDTHPLYLHTSGDCGRSTPCLSSCYFACFFEDSESAPLIRFESHSVVNYTSTPYSESKIRSASPRPPAYNAPKGHLEWSVLCTRGDCRKHPTVFEG